MIQLHFIGETVLASSLIPGRATATRYWRSQPIAGAVAWPCLPRQRANTPPCRNGISTVCVIRSSPPCLTFEMELE